MEHKITMLPLATLLLIATGARALQVRPLADVKASPLVAKTTQLLEKSLGERAPELLADSFEYRDGEVALTKRRFLAQRPATDSGFVDYAFGDVRICVASSTRVEARPPR